MFSIHSPDYVFTVLVSIFMKTHNHFWAPSQCYKYVFTAIICLYIVRVMEFSGFHYSRMRIANDTYHIRTNVPTPRLQHYVSALRCWDKKNKKHDVLPIYLPICYMSCRLSASYLSLWVVDEETIVSTLHAYYLWNPQLKAGGTLHVCCSCTHW